MKPEIKVSDRWLSIDPGAIVRFTPLGMWCQRVWQNEADYMCSGIRRNKDRTSITDSWDYRFTRVGEASVGDEFDDILLRGKDISRFFEGNDRSEIIILGGWIKLPSTHQGKEEGR